jgi:polyphosphate kinase
VFQQLASLSRVRTPRHLLVAPFTLHRRLLQCVALTEAAAREGRPARIVVKVNALTDPTLIKALIAAGQAGASIDLIVRGACMLPPEVAGVTENIRVRSIVGRFLEHTRIMYFRFGEGDGEDAEALYLGSADWMSRNMFGRIELAWPVRDPALRQRIIDECLVPYLRDECDAWAMKPDGSYRRIGTSGASAQRALMERFHVPQTTGWI